MAAAARKRAADTLAIVQAIATAYGGCQSKEGSRAFDQFQRELIEKTQQYDGDAEAEQS